MCARHVGEVRGRDMKEETRARASVSSGLLLPHLYTHVVNLADYAGPPYVGCNQIMLPYAPGPSNQTNHLSLGPGALVKDQSAR
jgi:hypothetical protein